MSRSTPDGITSIHHGFYSRYLSVNNRENPIIKPSPRTIHFRGWCFQQSSFIKTTYYIASFFLTLLSLSNKNSNIIIYIFSLSHFKKSTENSNYNERIMIMYLSGSSHVFLCNKMFIEYL